MLRAFEGNVGRLCYRNVLTRSLNLYKNSEIIDLSIGFRLYWLLVKRNDIFQELDI